MRLTLQQCDVHGVDWGGQTRLENGILTIDRGSLASQLLLDERVIGVDLEFARPGESCRIAPVFDVVEPRAKLEPRGFDFPGALTKVAPVGDGTTRVLRGAAVTVVGESSDARRLTDATSNVSPETAPQQRRERASVGHVIDFHSRPIEGFGPMEFSRYAALHHLVVMPRFAAGVEGDSRKNALRVAGLRAASHLASSVQVAAPDEEQTFELTPASEELPRVAYVYQLHSHQVPTVPGEPLLYGDNCRHLLPTILHPNEILDGAVVRSYHHLNMETYDIQNHGLILDLYRRHGRELNFAGVVAYVANQFADERARATVMASNLAKWTLRADGAVFTKAIGGAPNVDMALIADRCEQLGIKTSLILFELAATGDSADSALFNSRSLDAIVSIGASGLPVDLGPVDRVITNRPEAVEALRGPLKINASVCVGAMDHLGGGRFTGIRY